MISKSMPLRRMMVGTAMSLLALTPALAQTQAPAPSPSVQAPSTPDTAMPNSENTKPGFIAEQGKDQWLASKNLIGAKVTGPTNETVGSINDLLVEKGGNIVAAVIGVGGFLGIGQKNVAVPFKSLELARDTDNNEKVGMRFTKEELKQAPDFNALAPAPPKSASVPDRPLPSGTGMAAPGGPQPRH